MGGDGKDFEKHKRKSVDCREQIVSRRVHVNRSPGEDWGIENLHHLGWQHPNRHKHRAGRASHVRGTAGAASEGSEEPGAGNQGRRGPAWLDHALQVHGEDPIQVANDQQVRGLSVREVCAGEKARGACGPGRGTEATRVLTRGAPGRDSACDISAGANTRDRRPVQEPVF